MDPGTTTCWTLIDGAARGDGAARAEFSRRYQPVLRAYLRKRWQATRWLQDLDDAIQEVFLECFREEGVLEKTDSARGSGFRAFLYGCARNVARRFETRSARRREAGAPEGMLEAFEADEATLSHVFDRAWAVALIREALRKLARRESEADAATRYAELLELRFGDNLPIRAIAERWGEDPAQVHRHYAKAREAFKRELLLTVSDHHPGPRPSVEKECAELLRLVQ